MTRFTRANTPGYSDYALYLLNVAYGAAISRLDASSDSYADECDQAAASVLDDFDGCCTDAL